MFATAVPGLAPLVARELSEVPGVRVTDTGFDGRADFVLFEHPRGEVPEIRLGEDVFVEVGRTLRSEGDQARWIAGRIWRPARVRNALSVWSERVRPLEAVMTYRVIARVRNERAFMRTELRRHVGQVIGQDRPRWRVADPARIEVWVSEYKPGQFVAGLRLSDARMRSHDGRTVERQGALRPTVAAAMVGLAGDPDGVLLDPCCGSGTILGEAIAVGWRARGMDIDRAAVATAAENVPGASIERGDARRLGLADGSVAACVSNLPFGQQFEVQGEMDSWLTEVLAEMARVTRPGGRVVLLAPDIPRSVVPNKLRFRERHPIRLLGTKTTIWVYERSA